MSKAKFTPGPWVYPRDASKAPDTLIYSSVKPRGATSEHGACVASVNQYDTLTGLLPRGQYEANAHLIAAAPDLYAAIEALFGLSPKYEGMLYSERTKMATDALAKARGEAP